MGGIVEGLNMAHWPFHSRETYRSLLISFIEWEKQKQETYVIHRLRSSLITVLLCSLYIFPPPPTTLHPWSAIPAPQNNTGRPIESGMMRKRSSSGSSGSVSSRVQRSQEVMPLHPQHNYPYHQQQQHPSQQQHHTQQQQAHYAAQVVMHHGGPGGAVAAAGRLVRQTSRDSNDGSLHSVSSESSS